MLNSPSSSLELFIEFGVFEERSNLDFNLNLEVPSWERIDVVPCKGRWNSPMICDRLRAYSFSLLSNLDVATDSQKYYKLLSTPICYAS